MKGSNCCIRCGQALDLLEDVWAEDRGIMWNKTGEYCPSCYQELVDLQGSVK